jgi:NADH:ubiquinone oxidoreductase subunit 4 (subunit M)
MMGGLWGRKMHGYRPAISLFFAAAALGLPGTGNFIGEFLILMGTFVQLHRGSASIAALPAWYSVRSTR